MESYIEDQVLYVSFNQDSSLFAIGTEKGFHIFQSHPFEELYRKDFNAGIGIIELLNQTNIMGLVGGGKVPQFAPNKVMLWDVHKEEVLCEFRLSYNIKSIKLKKERLFILCDDMIYIYNLTTFERIECLDIIDYSYGLIAISQSPNTNIIAYAIPTKGQGCIKEYGAGKPAITFKAHTNSIGYIALNYDGTIVATASIKGTLIRVHDTKDGALVQELRRGSEQAVICSIAFDKNGKYLACSSERGTTHIFDLRTDTETKNKGSLIGKVAKMFNIQSNYLESQWSFAQYKTLPGKNIISFGSNESDNIIIVSLGKYYLAYIKDNYCHEIIKKDLIFKTSSK